MSRNRAIAAGPTSHPSNTSRHPCPVCGCVWFSKPRLASIFCRGEGGEPEDAHDAVNVPAEDAPR